ncbi:MAG: biotin carboxylase N-terminal domain-containing protein [Microscillaceae bacterium]|nr:biotin carboxylase N-terminal domain-containing protein [Microscillaceae bacterium]
MDKKSIDYGLSTTDYRLWTMDYGLWTDDHRPFTSILIANRGEIASRIIRTCRKMGIRSVAVFSEADREALFVKEADMAIFIGESNPKESYLNQDKLIDICKKYQIDGLHPGYGFLSENAEFARKCLEAGIVFIGPHPEAIEAMGSKSKAKALMQNHGVPIIPGYQGEDQSNETLKKVALNIGFPLLLKAAAGGGGKGMRIVQNAKELDAAIESAQREALNAFGNDELIIEKYIASGRHIEFQIFGDRHGNVLHLFERECTIQRRYQKIIEESPSPILSPELREKMAQAALLAAKALNYDNAGTVEFIFDQQTGAFYFLEVNTRLQVEHPVTEEITGLDLVQLQIEVAEGKPLKISQSDINAQGYAIECRLYAEDPLNDFRPATGKILHWEIPQVEGFRIETAVQSGSEISIYYDPMIAKLIVRAEDRPTAQRKMHYVLRNLLCLGLTTNQDFLIKLFENPEFRLGNYNTHFLSQSFDFDQLNHKNSLHKTSAAIAITLKDWYQREQSRKLLKSVPSGWRNSFYAHQQEVYSIDQDEFLLKYRYLKNNAFECIAEGNTLWVNLLEVDETRIVFEFENQRQTVHLIHSGNQYFLRNEFWGGISLSLKERFPEKEIAKIKGAYEAPMPSQVLKVLVEPGQKVSSGDSLLILSSMKMENTLSVDEEGIVEEIYAQEGQNVEAGFLLLKIMPNDQLTQNY